MRTKVAEICETGVVRTRILQIIFAAMFSLRYKNNFKRLSEVIGCTESTVHNWMKRSNFELPQFNSHLIKSVGSGDYAAIFDPSFIDKSGKRTPGVGRYWSGQAGQVKHGLDAACLAIGDRKQHTAYHLSAQYTPSPEDISAEGKTLMSHYTEFVVKHAAQIKEFSQTVVADAYFGTKTFVSGLKAVGLEVVSCLKSNAVLHYEAQRDSNIKKRGRPAQKAGRIKWSQISEDQLPIVKQDSEVRIRSGVVWSQSLRMKVRLVRVEFLNQDGDVRTTKLFFCTDRAKDWEWIWETYRLRFQIEFQFRDAKQHIGLTQCQSRNKVKMENHLNLSLSAVNIAKVCHWSRDSNVANEPFSMADIRAYYQNVNLLNRFSCALGIDSAEMLNNPKIISILFSVSYEKIAA